MKREQIIGHYSDSTLKEIGGRLTYYRSPLLPSKDEVSEVSCYACQKVLHLRGRDARESDRFWCSPECYKKAPWDFPILQEAPKDSASQKGEKTCPLCGGPARGRGYAHEETCSEIQKKSEKRVCSECGGSAKGRGFNHIGECSLKTQPYIPKGERSASSEEDLVPDVREDSKPIE